MSQMAHTMAERVAEDMQVLGSLSDKTFRSLLREMDRLSNEELRALVNAFLAFGPEPVSETLREELGPRPRRSRTTGPIPPP